MIFLKEQWSHKNRNKLYIKLSEEGKEQQESKDTFTKCRICSFHFKE